MTSSENDPDLEAPILALLEDEDYAGATSALVHLYGESVMGFIVVQVRNLARAEDVYQQLWIAVLQALPSFAGRSTLKTWVYVIARRISARSFVTRGPGERRLETSEQRALSADDVRTPTARWLRTEAKQWLWEAIQEFDEPDQHMLVLRLQNKMSWLEISSILTDEELTQEEHVRKAASLRKRYNRIKDRLAARRAELAQAAKRMDEGE